MLKNQGIHNCTVDIGLSSTTIHAGTKLCGIDGGT